MMKSSGMMDEGSLKMIKGGEMMKSAADMMMLHNEKMTKEGEKMMMDGKALVLDGEKMIKNSLCLKNIKTSCCPANKIRCRADSVFQAQVVLLEACPSAFCHINCRIQINTHDCPEDRIPITGRQDNET